MQLTGIHHLSAITSKIAQNHAFYTGALGMRLVKKTVNQDDVSAYHLFYADGIGSPGSDLTFFDFPAVRERFGTRSIVRTGLRVPVDSLPYWKDWLTQLKVSHGEIVERDGRPIIEFSDGEGQRLTLVGDAQAAAPNAWAKSPVPAEHQIRGLGPITISVPALGPTQNVLEELMNMRHAREYTGDASDGSDSTSSVHVFEMGPGGAAAELHVAVEPQLPRTNPGAGGVHHVAFRVPTIAEYNQWAKRLEDFGARSSGPVDRFYFKSLYFREPGGILFELATDEPGFSADEPQETMGQRLALPPFLEPHRAEIEGGLKPLSV